jgi:hypothetical protein
MTRISSSYSSSLDSKTLNRNKFCGRWSLRGEMHEHKERHYVRLRCKSWTCPRCGPKKAKRLRRAIMQSAQEKDLSRFLTLTLDPASCQSEDSTPYIRRCWNKFRTYLKRRYGTAVSFITVLELQKSGYAHLHILLDRFIPQAWISEAWQAVGGGKIVFIKHVDIHRIAPYLAKYLTKDLFLAGFKKRQRRYTTSRDITLFVTLSSGSWAVLKAPIEFIRRQFSELIVDEGHDADGLLESFRTSHSIGSPIPPRHLRDAIHQKSSGGILFTQGA